ncbi:MAG: hypothetical protein GY797_33610 [Deltaproteobacteria bacterium]|nr:hypothetical protein [Deltaproteobacteria bacterium]
MPKVKDTYLSNIRRGDILMYRAGSFLWPNFDILGGVIKHFEGNKGQDRNKDGKQDKGYSTGDYTHCAFVETTPNHEAEVMDLGDDIFKIKESNKKVVKISRPSKWDNERLTGERLTSDAGVRIHATWPCVQQDTIDWENHCMEVWRIRNITPGTIEGVMKLADDMLALGDVPAYQYGVANFLTFGNIRLPNGKICSHFIADPVYYASMLLGSTGVPICLTPDIDKNRDLQITPNDIINSGEVFRIRYQGIKK